jgi:hypothetical protein
MNLTHITSARSIGALAVAGALAAVGSGTAAADPPTKTFNYYAHVRPDDRAGAHGIGLQPVSSRAVTGPVRPDDRAGIHGVGLQPVSSDAVTGPVRPDDRSGIHGVGSPLASPSVTTADTSGFDWADAGIGAGTTFALIALGGAVFALRRRRDGAERVPTQPALHG